MRLFNSSKNKKAILDTKRSPTETRDMFMAIATILMIVIGFYGYIYLLAEGLS